VETQSGEIHSINFALPARLVTLHANQPNGNSVKLWDASALRGEMASPRIGRPLTSELVQRKQQAGSSRAGPPPFLCPRCTAVLQPWIEGMRQQTCPLCGERISR
jgi:hypothetical protein